VLRNVLLFLIGAGFVAASVGLIATGTTVEQVRGAWGGLLFFGGCMAVGAVDIVRQWRPALPSWGADFLHVRNERLRTGVLGLAAAAWLASGIVSLGGGIFPTLLAWVMIAFGGFGAAVLLGMALDGHVRVSVDREGIADYRLITQKIPWADVQSAGPSLEFGVPFIALRLKEPRAYAAKRTWLARTFGRKIDPMQITTISLAGSLADIEDAVQRWAPKAVAEQFESGQASDRASAD
jgi:hypothetical protein